jgi:hypothetical protein
MALSYLEAVNRMLSALGEDPVGSLTSGGTVGSNRCKIFVNDAWTELMTDSAWVWLSADVSLSSSGSVTPDIFNVSGLADIERLLITYDNTASYGTLPVPDEKVLLIGNTKITEEALWTPSTSGITLGSVRAYAANVYTATTAGTTGTTPPTHISGSVSDGGVTWAFSRVFTLPATPFAWSILSASQVRLRPYPGPVALQRYAIRGTLLPFRLANDNDVFTNLPIDFEPILIDMALAIAYAKHLDDPDQSSGAGKRAENALSTRRTRNRKQTRGGRIYMTNQGIPL